MRETRQSGSEGGEAESNRLSLPLSHFVQEFSKFIPDSIGLAQQAVL